MSSVPANLPTGTQTQAPPRVWRIGYMFGNCVQLVALGLVLNGLLFGEEPVWLSLRLGMIGLILWAIAREHAWAALIPVQISWFLRERPDSFSNIGLLHILTSLAAMLLIVYALRARRLRDQFSATFADGLTGRLANVTSPEDSVSMRVLRGVSGLLLAVVLIFAVLAAVVVILQYLPASFANRRWWFHVTHRNQHVFWPIFWGGIGLLMLLREISWRQLSGRQAGMFLRSELVLEHRREFGSFFRRARKLKKAKKE